MERFDFINWEKILGEKMALTRAVGIKKGNFCHGMDNVKIAAPNVMLSDFTATGTHIFSAKLS